MSEYFQGRVVKLRQINTTKERDMTNMKTVLFFSKYNNKFASVDRCKEDNPVIFQNNTSFNSRKQINEVMQVICSFCAAQTRRPMDQQRSMGRGLESTGRDSNCVALSRSAVQYCLHGKAELLSDGGCFALRSIKTNKE